MFEYHQTDISYLYQELLDGSGISSLQRRRKIALLMFLYDLMRGRVAESDLLSKINISVPRLNCRVATAFQPAGSRTNVLRYSILNRAYDTYNTVSRQHQSLDIYHTTRKKFQQELQEVL